MKRWRKNRLYWETRITGLLPHWHATGCFHDLLPNDVERIIMLESDVLVMGSLREMYDADMHGCYAACPGPEHKPVRHRELMKKYGGDTLTFVGSVYDVEKIRNDFTLQDILKVNAEANKKFGFSQQELTFGLLFAGKIKYFPGKESCIEENSQAIKEWGYDYIVQCEKQCKLCIFPPAQIMANLGIR